MNELNIINDYFQTKPPALMLAKQFFIKNDYIANYAEKSELSKMIEDAVETYCSGKDKQFNKYPFISNEFEKLFKHVEKYEENSIDRCSAATCCGSVCPGGAQATARAPQI